MIKFFRTIRQSLISEGKPVKYLKYAIGEIVLVVIGILIALQINNWNEERKSKIEFRQSMLALAEEIKSDTIAIQHHINSMKNQSKATGLLIPIMESEKREIKDSLEFIKAFMELSNASSVDINTELWDEIKKLGLHKKHGDPVLINRIQAYYYRYNRTAINWENAYKTRIEIRELKYEFLNQSDLDKIRSEEPKIPSKEAYNAIFEEKRVLDLTKSIHYTSFYFERIFERRKENAVEVLQLIEKEFNHTQN